MHQDFQEAANAEGMEEELDDEDLGMFSKYVLTISYLLNCM